MKRLALICLVVLVPLTLSAQRHHTTPTPTPSPDPKGVIVKQGMVCRTKQQDLELRDWIGGLMNQVHEAQLENKASKEANDHTETLLGMSVVDAAKFIRECSSDRECAKAPLSCWFHRLIKHIFWIAGAIVVLLIALIVINIMTGGALSGFFAIFGAIGKWIARLFTPKPPPPLP